MPPMLGGGDMADKVYELDLKARGGVHYFRNWTDVLSMLAAERAHWGWLASGNFSDRTGVTGWVPNRLQWALSTAQEFQTREEPIGRAEDILRDLYLGNDAILHSQGETGCQIDEIKNVAGPVSAAFAYSFAQGRTPATHANSVEEFRGMVLLTAPSTIPSIVIAEGLQRERRNLKDRVERQLERLELAEEERESAFRSTRLHHEKLAKRFMRLRFGAWRAEAAQRAVAADDARAALARLHSTSAADFTETKALYEEALKLQAPVKYWEGKADTHRRAEGFALLFLWLYFPLAIGALATTFGFTGYELLKHTGPPPSAALLFIISGGLATIAAVTFWIGRILTKLYLSEHHLRHDAEERAIMTTTYLALTREQAASDADRQIILAALFRTTPDGIVKDDGPPDLGLGALISRQLTSTR